METKNTNAGIVIEKNVPEYLVIKVPTKTMPATLKNGKTIVDEIKNYSEKVKHQRLTDQLERFLKKACKAENCGNYFRAAKAFYYASHCEGKLRSDVGNVHYYTHKMLPIY